MHTTADAMKPFGTVQERRPGMGIKARPSELIALHDIIVIMPADMKW